MKNTPTDPLQVDFELFRDELDKVRNLIPNLPTKKVLRPKQPTPEQYASNQEYYTSIQRLNECHQRTIELRRKRQERKTTEQPDQFLRFATAGERDKKNPVVSHKDVYFPEELQPIIDKLNEHYPQDRAGLVWEPRGFFVYPPGGFMEWHTNEHQSGTRVYFTYAEEGGKSGINFVHENRDFENDVIESPDIQGWQNRSFFVGDGSSDPANWHCIWSNTTRLSIGFGIIERPWQKIPGALVS